jgi:hypothetical protein
MKTSRWVFVQVMSGASGVVGDGDPVHFRHHWVTASSESDAYDRGHEWADTQFGRGGQHDVLNDYVIEAEG